MTAFVDTNILVRHLTLDPPAMAKRATRFLAQAEELFLADLVVAEMAYVLESFYEVPRAQVGELLRAVLVFDGMEVVDRDLLLRAVEVYVLHRLDFAEAYLVASGEATGVGAVASFDRTIDRVGTVERVEPR